MDMVRWDLESERLPLSITYQTGLWSDNREMGVGFGYYTAISDFNPGRGFIHERIALESEGKIRVGMDPLMFWRLVRL